MEMKTLTILDVDFQVSMPYTEGHVINAAEAKVLNQTRRENLSNNFRSEVRKHIEGGEGAKTLDELQADFAKMEAEYVFTLSNAGTASRKLDPIEREARNLARQLIKDSLAADGRKIGEAPEGVDEQAWKDAIEAKIDEVAAMPEVDAEAKKVVKARDNAGKITLGSLGLGTPAA